MVKHPRRRRQRGRYVKGNIDENLSLGTLAAAALVSDLWDDVVSAKMFISSIDVAWMLFNITPTQGPILFGIAHSDYTDAEIEEVIENTNSWDVGDLVDQEIARRKVKIIGLFVGNALDIAFNDNKPMKTKLNWVLNSGENLRMWAYNRGSGNLSTTVPIMRAAGHANLWTTGN